MFKPPRNKMREGARVFNDRELTPEEEMLRAKRIEAENQARRNRPKPKLKGQPARRAAREGKRL